MFQACLVLPLFELSLPSGFTFDSVSFYWDLKEKEFQGISFENSEINHGFFLKEKILLVFKDIF